MTKKELDEMEGEEWLRRERERGREGERNLERRRKRSGVMKLKGGEGEGLGEWEVGGFKERGKGFFAEDADYCDSLNGESNKHR